MCGIGAFQIVGGECDPRMVARVLLRLLEVRGRDASGVAWHDKGETYIRKAAVSGSVLARQLDDAIGTTGVVHTRWATQGSPANPNNNHPIDARGVVGVHNGHCSNDNQLLQTCVGYKRRGEVDSEAIFALIAHGRKGSKLRERLADVRGSAALLWLRTNDQHERLHIARLSSSPLAVGLTKGGSIIAASTESILRETAKRCRLTLDVVHVLSEGTYMRCEKGSITETQTVAVPRTWYTALPNYAAASTFTTGKGKGKSKGKSKGKGKDKPAKQELPQPLSEVDQLTLEALLAADADAEAAALETDTLRDAMDRQFRMGRYGDHRW